MKFATVGVLAMALATPACSTTGQDRAEGPRLVVSYVGRFAVMADVASIHRQDSVVEMRAFQVVGEDFTAAGEAYWGGWSRWRFDCTGGTADRLDFASVRAGGIEGPATPDTAAPTLPTAGGEAESLLKIACGPAYRWKVDATTLEDAVRIGRAALTPKS